ncbi:hypothetical protein CBER1_03117 [Cercospora berteroae]|uniref:Uncharacterized protein n=1 Tax=Cercospora berteroae TaxID=357750 RepID=A0A2S6CK71_9PEZI|nr:hypothetical protein CBER1_03117 [Cercospora berteroae]
MHVIAEEPRDPLDAATEAQKATCKKMDAAQLDQQPYQRHADFAKGFKELTAAFEMRAEELKEGVATTEKAFTALPITENQSAAQGEYGVTNSGAYKRPQAQTEEDELS